MRQKKTDSKKRKNFFLKTILSYFFILFTVVFNSFYSVANQFEPSSPSYCSNIDLRQDFELKMRNQQETSWCFAHAASDLLQFQYRISEQISAADIAISYSETDISKAITNLKKIFGNRNKTPAETGFIKIAIDNILNQGYCPESALPSEKWLKVDRNGNQTEIEITQAISEIADIQEKIQRKDYKGPNELPWYFKFENINQETFFNTLLSTSKKNIFTRLKDIACFYTRKPFPNLELNPVFKLKSKNNLQSIHQMLDNRTPVTIDFFGDVLRNYKNPKKRINELHTVLVYGRKFDSEKNKCMFLIKDSYGEQCNKYDKLIECEKGNLWLAEDKIFNSMTSSLIFFPLK